MHPPHEAASLARMVPALRQRLRDIEPRPLKGRVMQAVGTMIHAVAPGVRLGEVCKLRDPRTGHALLAEVVGIRGDATLLTPIGGLQGLSTRTEVMPTGAALRVPVGRELLGRVLDSLGRPIDGAGKNRTGPTLLYPIDAAPPAVLSRSLIAQPLPLGLRALDGLLTVGEGQRLGIYGPPGTGKSTLLAQIVKGTEADVAVVAMIGERGREVREFIDVQLGQTGMKKSVVVVATSDQSAMERSKAAYVTTAIAEYFRDQGQRVLLVMDSLTRFARALREIGLAAGEPPTRRGFPPSVFQALPRLLERAGPSDKGSITAFYTVLVEGDGTLDPIAEETRAILDGHIVLSPKLAQIDHYPAIDVLDSRSRVMPQVVGSDHRARTSRVRELLARYAEIEFLLRIGEYKAGSDPVADEAIKKMKAIKAFLCQLPNENSAWAETQSRLRQLTS